MTLQQQARALAARITHPEDALSTERETPCLLLAGQLKLAKPLAERTQLPGLLCVRTYAAKCAQQAVRSVCTFSESFATELHQAKRQRAFGTDVGARGEILRGDDFATISTTASLSGHHLRARVRDRTPGRSKVLCWPPNKGLLASQNKETNSGVVYIRSTAVVQLPLNDAPKTVHCPHTLYRQPTPLPLPHEMLSYSSCNLSLTIQPPHHPPQSLHT